MNVEIIKFYNVSWSLTAVLLNFMKIWTHIQYVDLGCFIVLIFIKNIQ